MASAAAPELPTESRNWTSTVSTPSPGSVHERDDANVSQSVHVPPELRTRMPSRVPPPESLAVRVSVTDVDDAYVAPELIETEPVGAVASSVCVQLSVEVEIVSP